MGSSPIPGSASIFAATVAAEPPTSASSAHLGSMELTKNSSFPPGPALVIDSEKQKLHTNTYSISNIISNMFFVKACVLIFLRGKLAAGANEKLPCNHIVVSC